MQRETVHIEWKHTILSFQIILDAHSKVIFCMIKVTFVWRYFSQFCKSYVSHHHDSNISRFQMIYFTLEKRPYCHVFKCWHTCKNQTILNAIYYFLNVKADIKNLQLFSCQMVEDLDWLLWKKNKKAKHTACLYDIFLIMT